VDRIALIIVDMVKDFVRPDGIVYFPDAEAIVPAVARLLQAARQSRVPIIYLRDSHQPDEERWDWELRSVKRHCITSTGGDEIVEELAPPEGAMVIPKRRYSGFMGTDLDMRLRDLRIEAVVLCGVKTNVCVRATAQDAFQRGYRVLVPREAVSSNRPHLHEASLEDIDRYMGAVISVDEAVRILETGRIPQVLRGALEY